MSADVDSRVAAVEKFTSSQPDQKQPWGQLRLTSWEPKGQHPLVDHHPNAVKLTGDAELIVGRNSQSVLRLHKSLVWCSNKHFVVKRDSETAAITLRDTSSNGTWVNGERVDKEKGRVLQYGDLIELAAEEGTEHRQVTFAFDSRSGAAKGGALRSGEPLQKRPRISSAGNERPLAVNAGAGAPAISPSMSTSASTVVGHGTVEASGGSRTDTTPTSTSIALPGLQQALEKARREAESALLRAELLAAEAAGEEARSAAAAAHGSATAAASVAANEQTEAQLRAQLDEMSAQHQSERERLVERASESAQQLQSALQEQAAQLELKEAAEEAARKLQGEVDAAGAKVDELASELERARAKADAAEEEARTEREAARKLRAALAGLRGSIDAALDAQPAENGGAHSASTPGP